MWSLQHCGLICEGVCVHGCVCARACLRTCCVCVCDCVHACVFARVCLRGWVRAVLTLALTTQAPRQHPFIRRKKPPTPQMNMKPDGTSTYIVGIGTDQRHKENEGRNVRRALVHVIMRHVCRCVCVLMWASAHVRARVCSCL